RPLAQRTPPPRRSLRPERKLGCFRHVGASAIAILESVHFLLDDIRCLADGAAEKLGFFQYRNADLRKIVSAEDFARLGFNRLPDLDLARENIRKAFDGRNFHSVPNYFLRNLQNYRLAKHRVRGVTQNSQAQASSLGKLERDSWAQRSR